MSDDVELRLLDLELRFGHLLANIAETFEAFRGQAVELTEQTSAVITIILEELMADGSLDRDSLVQAMEAHAGRLGDGGRFGGHRIVVDTLLARLRHPGADSRSTQ